jgi:hypothetical protein
LPAKAANVLLIATAGGSSGSPELNAGAAGAQLTVLTRTCAAFASVERRAEQGLRTAVNFCDHSLELVNGSRIGFRKHDAHSNSRLGTAHLALYSQFRSVCPDYEFQAGLPLQW